MPLDGRAAAAVEGGALAAGRRAAFAPQVVVERVVLDGDVVPVAAHFGRPGEEGGGARQGGGEGAGEESQFHGCGSICVCVKVKRMVVFVDVVNESRSGSVVAVCRS